MKTAAAAFARQLPMHFDAWMTPTRTCVEHIATIRSLPSVAPTAAREYFAIADAGSVMFGTVTLVTHAA